MDDSLFVGSALVLHLPIIGPVHLSVKVADCSSTSVTEGRPSVGPEHLKESDLSWAHGHKRNGISLRGGDIGQCRVEI